MPRAQESAGLSKAATIDLPVGADAGAGASTTFLGELHDKASAISALIEREYAGNIAYAANFSRAQGLITGMAWSPEDAATSWPWPPDASAD
ncbi:hypothetical protein [Dichotomicrobium thermohalophilum]|uniref:Uncharacterized protein n=1 Tax=Dichotomicrobium thermohalophilum TaxID=933063 RepID=A0A397PDP8_9HYPH|nr:hypothetical protein [Dichotomicrobium thermohalophilum]RIA47626.1 hypothetical protein BXY53_2186 [Dichotomicrobium thermohalophilum]